MKPQLALAYFGVVLIWTTTPLAIKWSSIGVSYVFGATGRMSIGLACLLVLLLLRRKGLPCHRLALRTYLAVSMQIYASMLITYWSARFVPSGWISVIFGLGPFITAFMAAAYLKERSLGWRKLAAYSLGAFGLAVMFSSARELHPMAIQGTLGILLATFIHAASAVWVKQIDAKLPSVQQITGGLLISVPLYWLTWLILDDGALPTQIQPQTLYAIVYLGVVATTLGFALYYYVLGQLPATDVAMMNLMTPVLSLLLGYLANREPITMKTVVGTSLIMAALALHQRADRASLPVRIAKSKNRRAKKNRGR
ncbi:DMT family transporter [Methylomonas sp. MED-D]|uniref:DMT family transporter n=1 Tax=unclassified Methylomonas TaxID=2608980 RepID=UPI0028A4ED12|nr:DMT family transporter [Methylomonas sp. MV1]MDT4328576.1 DMT family transporter [Methylomonas sp. MV1]